MSDISNRKSDMDPARISDPAGTKGVRTALLIIGALVALAGAYLLFFLSLLMIGFSFDAPGAKFWDSGAWLRLLALWPPTSLLLVAIAAVVCIFRASLRLLWIALGIFAATAVAIFAALNFVG
ncbi:hypothetical protein [Sphingopyxis sp.]|jgi:hypothetical protein|uniref:hypothetical protein n=1 Tax=Sphingopyxis sp. TaxID=1908224 RepID=UPI003F724B07